LIFPSFLRNLVPSALKVKGSKRTSWIPQILKKIVAGIKYVFVCPSDETCSGVLVAYLIKELPGSFWDSQQKSVYKKYVNLLYYK
jgi:hypothetical protein